MYVVYRSSAGKDEEPSCSQLTAGRYSIMFCHISRYSLAILTSTFSVTAYVSTINMKDKKQEKNIIQTKKNENRGRNLRPQIRMSVPTHVGKRKMNRTYFTVKKVYSHSCGKK